jgi:hypothetical protein
MSRSYRCYGCHKIIDYNSLSFECMCCHPYDAEAHYRGICNDCKDLPRSEWTESPDARNHHLKQVKRDHPDLLAYEEMVQRHAPNYWGIHYLSDDLAEYTRTDKDGNLQTIVLPMYKGQIYEE